MILSKKGFTLVELIVVITILAILAGLGFVSYIGYTSQARDSNRMANLSAIHKGLELKYIKDAESIMPDDSITITSTGSVIGYQGIAGPTLLNKISYAGEGLDPKDKTYYSYFLSADRKKRQILGFLENQKAYSKSSYIHSSYANTDYASRYPFFQGLGLGLILDNIKKPINLDTDIANQGIFDVYNPTYADKLVNAIFNNISYNENAALFVGGQIEQIGKDLELVTKESCPENFVPVPGNDFYGQPDFCIGKYEAYREADGRFSTKPGVTPTGNVNFITGPESCFANGKGYHVMTLNQWATIARNIEQQGQNWSGGEVGSGSIKGGNNGYATTGINTGGLLDTGTNGNQSQDNMRQHVLSNGEVIWDFVGNLWETVQPMNNANFNGDSDQIMYEISQNAYVDIWSAVSIDGLAYGTKVEWSEITDENFRKNYGPLVTTDATKGAGKVRQSADNFFLVGGDYSQATTTGSEGENGLFSLLKISTTTYSTVGTRCAYIPN